MRSRDTTIGRQLMTLMLLTTAIVLTLTWAVFISYQLYNTRLASTAKLQTLAQVIATNSTASLAFQDVDDATDILSALRAEPTVTQAALYDSKGVVFATYPSSMTAAHLPGRAPPDGYRSAGHFLVAAEPVVQAGSSRLGTLYMQADMRFMAGQVLAYSGIAAVGLAGALLFAYLISRVLQRRISAPILALAETSRAISERRDYSVRVPPVDVAELGALSVAFNQMLAQIQEQHNDLQSAYEEVRHSQQAVMQQERLKALGQIASGVAHDINNAMSPIALYAEALLEREKNLTPRGREYLVTIQRAIEDVAETVARMREFYRKREPQLVLGRVNLNALVTQAVELTRPRWSDMPQERGIVVTLRTHLTTDLPEIMGAQSEIRDALTNLIFNAVDAMQEGGNLTIATRMVTDRPSSEESARHVYLEVSDTGIGMDEETRRRCLEPFFTTKGERGTGLGLAMVFGMIQRHSAEIEIDSVPAKGSTVRLIFAPVETASVTMTPAPAPRQGRPLKLLIIDDDPLVIESLQSVLVNEGNVVTSANGGQQGIDTFSAALANHTPFEAVITDLGMPYVDGRKVAAAVKEASPATPVILLTGWGQRLRSDNEIPEGVDRVLSKPPKLRELRAVLAELAGETCAGSPAIPISSPAVIATSLPASRRLN